VRRSRRFQTVTVGHLKFGLVPGTYKFTGLALQLSAKVHTDVGYDFGDTIDFVNVKLPAKECYQLAALVRDFFNSTYRVLHNLCLLFRCIIVAYTIIVYTTKYTTI
jgi:hypothetical protein